MSPTRTVASYGWYPLLDLASAAFVVCKRSDQLLAIKDFQSLQSFSANRAANRQFSCRHSYLDLVVPAVEFEITYQLGVGGWKREGVGGFIADEKLKEPWADDLRI